MSKTSAESILERIDRRLTVLAGPGKEKLSDNAASLMAGMSRDGIRTIRRQLESGKQAGLRSLTLEKLAKGLKTTPNWLLTGDGTEEVEPTDTIELTSSTQSPRAAPKSTTAANHLANNARIAGPIDGFTRVPIRGQGMGGKDGALIFNADHNMGDVLAPPVLFGVPDAYAVYVIGDSMLERFREGEVVYVHPYMPVRKDDDCVIQVAGEHEGDPPVGWIKRFVSMDDVRLKVRQLNPKKVMTFPRNRVISVHRIVMSGPV